jgi:hypothetical protein
MKFRVIGANRETGARMTLEFDAESKAAAERKASQSGMSVNRVEDITDGSVAHAMEPATRRRGGDGSFGLLIRFIILIGLAAAAFWWFYWRTHHHLPGM